MLTNVVLYVQDFLLSLFFPAKREKIAQKGRPLFSNCWRFYSYRTFKALLSSSFSLSETTLSCTRTQQTRARILFPHLLSPRELQPWGNLKHLHMMVLLCGDSQEVDLLMDVPSVHKCTVQKNYVRAHRKTYRVYTVESPALSRCLLITHNGHLCTCSAKTHISWGCIPLLVQALECQPNGALERRLCNKLQSLITPRRIHFLPGN